MSWPRLTETLTGPRAHDACTSCGARPAELLGLTLWRECNDQDMPEERFILLCRRCNEIIEPHPRLYVAIHRWSPAPGAMAMCAACEHRDGLRCRMGTVAITPGKHLTAFVDGRGKDGRRRGWIERAYTTPPQACTAFTKVETVQL